MQDELLTAREDAEPLVRWRGAEVRRFRRKLYLLPEAAFAPRAVDAAPPLTGDGRAVDVGTGLGTLRLRAASPCEGPGIDPVLVANGLQLKFRTGGESAEIRFAIGQTYTERHHVRQAWSAISGLWTI